METPAEATDTDAILARMALKAYSGERCAYCGEVFDTLESLDSAVVATVAPISIAHQECFDRNRPMPLTKPTDV